MVGRRRSLMLRRCPFFFSSQVHSILATLPSLPYFLLIFSLSTVCSRSTGWICTRPVQKAPVDPEVTVDQSGVQNCDRREPALHHQPPIFIHYVSLRRQIRRYCRFVGSRSELGSDFVGFETKLAGNAATRARMRPSTALGLGGERMGFSRFPQRCS